MSLKHSSECCDDPALVPGRHSMPPMPPVHHITAAQLQFVDNSKRQRKQGRSPYTLKLEVYLTPSDINVVNCDWWRVIQLIEPARVRKWAEQKLMAGDMEPDGIKPNRSCHRERQQGRRPLGTRGLCSPQKRLQRLGCPSSSGRWFPVPQHTPQRHKRL
jgi:hypothetical protein